MSLIYRAIYLIVWINFLIPFSIFSYSQKVVFDKQNLSQVPDYQPFDATIDVTRSGNSVTITFPSLTLALSNSHFVFSPPQPITGAGDAFSTLGFTGGTIYSKTSVIPKGYRPASLLGIYTTVATSPSTSLPVTISILHNGQIYISALTSGFGLPTFTTIDGIGPYTTAATSITYNLPTVTFNSPTNFILNTGLIQAYLLPIHIEVNQYLDAYINDFNSNGIFACCWMDNYGVPLPYPTNMLVRTGSVALDGSVTLNASATAITGSTLPAGDHYYCTQGSVSFNPTNLNVLTANSLIITSSGLLYGVYAANSIDGGVTWNQQKIDGVNGVPPNDGGDNNGIYDSFGNYYVTNIGLKTVTYMGSMVSERVLTIILGSNMTTSSPTYSELISYVPTDYPNGDTNSFFDFNQMAFGSDGSGGYALYFMADFNTTTAQYPCIGYIPVTGLGAANIHPNSTYITFLSHASVTGILFGTPSISATGDIYGYYWLSAYSGATYSYNCVIKISGGVAGLQKIQSGMSSPLILTGPNVCNFGNISLTDQKQPGIGTTYSCFNAKNIRGSVPFQPVKGVIYDDSRGALFVLSYEIDPLYSQNTNLYLSASKSLYQWSEPYQVKNNPLGNCFQASMSLGTYGTAPTTKKGIYVTWYDSSADQPLNQYTQFYGAFISSEDLDAIVATIP